MMNTNPDKGFITKLMDLLREHSETVSVTEDRDVRGQVIRINTTDPLSLNVKEAARTMIEHRVGPIRIEWNAIVEHQTKLRS